MSLLIHQRRWQITPPQSPFRGVPAPRIIHTPTKPILSSRLCRFQHVDKIRPHVERRVPSNKSSMMDRISNVHGHGSSTPQIHHSQPIRLWGFSLTVHDCSPTVSCLMEGPGEVGIVLDGFIVPRFDISFIFPGGTRHEVFSGPKPHRFKISLSWGTYQVWS